jgi:hypothetical protein
MNGRGLRSGALRLVATAAVALGIALFAGASTARVVSSLSDEASQSVVVIGDDGAGAASVATTPTDQYAPLEVTWS